METNSAQLVDKIVFRRTQPTDKSMLHRWFAQPHVQEFFYGQGLKNTLRNIDLFCQDVRHNDEYYFEHWLASIERQAFAFLMTSTITGPFDPNDSYQRWYIEGKQTFTLDLLIGETMWLGKGLAHSLIQRFILTEFPHADYFLIDPEVINVKAIHVYQKAGFKQIDEICPTFNPKPHKLMRLAVDELRDSDKKTIMEDQK